MVKLPLRLKIEQKLPTLRLEIFDVLSFVENEITPTFPSKSLMVLNYKFVRCDTHMECVRFGPPFKSINKKKSSVISVTSLK